MLERGQRMLGIGLNEDTRHAAYLACFHTAQADIFERQDRAVKTHHGVQNTFFLLTAHDPRVDPTLRSFLSRGFDLKSIADYATGPKRDNDGRGRSRGDENRRPLRGRVRGAGGPSAGPVACGLG
jgi:uncharacterized protein (UPF0332 family)